MKTRRSLGWVAAITLIAAGALVGLILSRTPPRPPVTGSAGPDSPGLSGETVTAADPASRRRVLRAGLPPPATPELAANAERARARCRDSIRFELDKIQSRIGLSGSETDAIVAAVVDYLESHQATELELAQVTRPEVGKTVVAIPAFPEAGWLLEQGVKADIAAAIADPARGSRVVGALEPFLVHQFFGFGQHSQEIVIQAVGGPGGAPAFSFQHRWTGGMELASGPKPVAVSFTGTINSQLPAADLMQYDFLAPFLPRP